MRIKLSLVFFLLFSFGVEAFSQSVGIGNNKFTPEQSAALEIRSIEKGLLIPRMSETERDAIVTPAIGLLIYQTDGAGGFYYFDGSLWQPLMGSVGTDNQNLAGALTGTILQIDIENGSSATVDLASINTDIDPVYTSSPAANITVADINNLNNLSGINTGDQDISNLVSKVALSDSITQLRSELADTSLLASKLALSDSITQLRSELADTSLLASKLALSDSITQLRGELTDTSLLVTKSVLGDSITQLRSELADTSLLASKVALSDSITQIRSEIADTSLLATKSVLGDSITRIREEIAVLATKSVLGDSITQLRGELADTSLLASKVALSDSITQLRSELADTSLLASKVALSDSITQIRSELADTSLLASKVALSDSITQIRSELADTSLLASKVALSDSITQIRGEIVDTSLLATKSVLGDSITRIRNEIAVLATKVALSDSITQIRGELADTSLLVTKLALADSIANVRSKIPTGETLGDMSYWGVSGWVTAPIAENEGEKLSRIGGIPTWILPPPEIGDYRDGGVVFYIDATGEHGLVCAIIDQSTGTEWGCIGTNLPGADGTAIGTGAQNTVDIVTGCNTVGIAAKLCNDLILNGYNDWYLPSVDELHQMYRNKGSISVTIVAIGGTDFASDSYWCSSEIDDTKSKSQNFNDGSQSDSNKDGVFYVRAVRAF